MLNLFKARSQNLTRGGVCAMRRSAGENSLFFLVILKQCLVCFNSAGIWLFLTNVFELLREYCLTNSQVIIYYFDFAI